MKPVVHPVEAMLGKRIFLSSWSTLPLYVALVGWPLGPIISSNSWKGKWKPKPSHASSSSVTFFTYMSVLSRAMCLSLMTFRLGNPSTYFEKNHLELEFVPTWEETYCTIPISID